MGIFIGNYTNFKEKTKMQRCTRCGTESTKSIHNNFCPNCGRRFGEKPNPTPLRIAEYIQRRYENGETVHEIYNELLENFNFPIDK